MGVWSGFQSLRQQVEKARAKTVQLWHRAEKGWKQGMNCFGSISRLVPRCMRPADETEVAPPSDGKLHEDRPLLKHRHSLGFAARQARGAAEATAKRAHDLSSTLAKKGKAASGELRRRAKNLGSNATMSVPTPVRARAHSERGSFDSNDSLDEDDEVFQLGSDDEDEEEEFSSFPIGKEGKIGPLNDAISAWGRPGECIDPFGSPPTKVGMLNLGGSPQANGPNTFYMGTPRDCM